MAQMDKDMAFHYKFTATSVTTTAHLTNDTDLGAIEVCSYAFEHICVTRTVLTVVQVSTGIGYG